MLPSRRQGKCLSALAMDVCLPCLLFTDVLPEAWCFDLPSAQYRCQYLLLRIPGYLDAESMLKTAAQTRILIQLHRGFLLGPKPQTPNPCLRGREVALAICGQFFAAVGCVRLVLGALSKIMCLFLPKLLFFYETLKTPRRHSPP